MPIFSYTCPKGHESERLEKEAKSFIRCPDCGKRAKRSWNSVGVRFHGSGFHNTDYKPKPKQETKKKATKSEEA